MVNPDYQGHSDKMSHPKVNTAVIKTVADYLDGKPKKQFKTPKDDKIAVGDRRSIASVHCAPMSAATAAIRDAGFAPSTGSPIASDCPAGTAAATEPSGSTIKGGGVTIRPSSG